MKKPELLLPAGSLDSLKTAFLYGADAVYAGFPQMNLRAASDFPLEDIQRGIFLAHEKGRKVYLALNLFSQNHDADRLKKSLSVLNDLSPDGLIVSDPGIFQTIKEQFQNIPLHISTQANICSYLTVNFWEKMGASLAVLGRETSFADACRIRKECPNIKLEIFIHGSMCISYSGRCLLSAFMAGRGANKGDCAHSCRWKYKSKLLLQEELRPDEYYEMFEDDNGSYILNSKDLCLMPKLAEILSAGFDSLKIEGRNKSEYYVAQTARVYRKAIDDYFENPAVWKPSIYMAELMTLQNRGYTLGFFDGIPTKDDQDFEDTSSKSEWRNAGTVISVGDKRVKVEVHHKIRKGDILEILSPHVFEPLKITVDEMFDGKTGEALNEISAGRPGQSVDIVLPSKYQGREKVFEKYWVVRIKK